MNTSLVTLSIFLFVLCADISIAQTPQEAGSQLGKMAVDSLGDNMQQRLGDPLISQGRQMTTLDGNTSFNASLPCNEKNGFLEVSATVGTGGDLENVIVKDDVDLNGVTGTYPLPFIVSGICLNGIITAPSGSWANRQFYKWTHTGTSYGLVKDTFTNSRGCYCINESCGYTAAVNQSNLSTHLVKFSEALIRLARSITPDISLVSHTYANGTLTYSGQESGACTTNAITGNVPALTAYKENTASMEADAANRYQTDNIIASMPVQTPIETINCSIKRNVTITMTSELAATPNSQVYRSYTANDWAYIFADCGTGVAHPISVVLAAVSVCNNSRAYTASELQCLQQRYLNGETHIVDYRGDTICVSAGDLCYGFHKENYMDYQCIPYINTDTVGESLTDTCTVTAANPDCWLQYEDIDGVVTFQNSKSTGNIPPATTKTFYGYYANDVTRDWWMTQRTYACKSTAADYSNLLNRSRTIKRTSSISSDLKIITATDITGEIYSMGVNGNATFTKCVSACKVSIETTDTATTEAGTRGTLNTTTARTQYLTKTCLNNICPLEAGETMIEPCGCLSDFGHAVSTLAVLEAAGQDMSCNGGNWVNTNSCKDGAQRYCPANPGTWVLSADELTCSQPAVPTCDDNGTLMADQVTCISTPGCTGGGTLDLATGKCKL